MKRIVILGSYAPSLTNFRGPMLQAMSDAGHEVYACAPNASPEIIAALDSMGVHYEDVPLNRTGINPVEDVTTMTSLAAMFARLNPDVLLSYTIKPVIYGSLMAALTRVPRRFSMITGLGYVFIDSGLKQRFIATAARQLYRLSLRTNDRIFFQNPDDRDLFESLGLIRSKEQAVLINGSGVDVDYYAPRPLPNSPVFLFIGRLLHNKGIREYVAAARKLKKAHPKTRFLLLGRLDNNPDAVSRETLQKWIDDEIIEYLGVVDDVRPIIAKSSVYVLPSYREGTPRTVLEAMSMGRPIITSDAPGCRETVVDGENGFLVSPRNSDALADAMERLIRTPALRSKMGRKSRRLCEEKYDVHLVNGVILETMELR